MSVVPDAPGFRRILVALDASKESLAALETAAGLAARLEAELAGLFIEDTDLLNLAALPFSREAPALSRSGRALDPERLERDLKARAASARQALARAADALQLPWSFRVVRGRVEAELLAAARDVDLIAVGKGTRPLTGDARIGRRTRAVAAQTGVCMLFASAVACAGDAPVAVVDDGGAGWRETLGLAAQMAERQGRRLLVFVLGDSPVMFAEREAAVREQVRTMGASATIRRIRGTGMPDIVRAVQSEPVALLVVGTRRLPSDEGAALDLVVEKSACSVLIVRT